MHVALLQDMQGGKLTVAGSDMDPLAEEHVQPETNLLVRFRGNATHRLRSLPKNGVLQRPSLSRQCTIVPFSPTSVCCC